MKRLYQFTIALCFFSFTFLEDIRAETLIHLRLDSVPQADLDYCRAQMRALFTEFTNTMDSFENLVNTLRITSDPVIPPTPSTVSEPDYSSYEEEIRRLEIELRRTRNILGENQRPGKNFRGAG